MQGAYKSRWAVFGAHTEKADANDQHAYHGAQPPVDTGEDTSVTVTCSQRNPSLL